MRGSKRALILLLVSALGTGCVESSRYNSDHDRNYTEAAVDVVEKARALPSVRSGTVSFADDKGNTRVYGYAEIQRVLECLNAEFPENAELINMNAAFENAMAADPIHNEDSIQALLQYVLRGIAEFQRTESTNCA